MTVRLTRPHMPPKLRSELAGFSRLMNSDRLDDQITEHRLDVLGMFGPGLPEDDEQSAVEAAEVDKDRYPDWWWSLAYAKEYRNSIFKILQRAPVNVLQAMLRLVEIEVSVNRPEDWPCFFTRVSYARFIACFLGEALHR